MFNSIGEIVDWLKESNWPQKIALQIDPRIAQLPPEELHERQTALTHLVNYLQQMGYAMQQINMNAQQILLWQRMVA